MNQKLFALAALAIAAGLTPALAQSTSPQTNQAPAAQRAPANQPANAALEPGANSFTEEQARSRIEAAGFQNVTGLRKDDQGIWRGRATRGGQQVNVGLDYRGNIATQ